MYWHDRIDDDYRSLTGDLSMNEKEKYIKDVESWIERIKSWDCDDVYYLRDIIRSYPSIPDTVNWQDLQSYAESQWDRISQDLPIAEEYEDRVLKHASYPIWTCDHQGYCLVGDVADSVVSIEDIENSE